jgi:hypothetical protein
MGLLKEIEELQEKTLAIILVVLLSLAPGILLIFHFNKELFNSLDFLKLSILAVSYTWAFAWLPLTLGIIYSNLRGKLEEENTENHSLWAGIGIAMLVSNLSILPSLLTAYLFSLSFRNTQFLAIIMDVIISSTLLLAIRDLNRRNNKQAKH